MSKTQILVLAAFIISGIDNSIVDDFAYGNAPEVNLSLLWGDWFLIASTDVGDHNICMSNFIREYEDGNFTIFLTSYPKPGVREVNSNSSYEMTIDSIGPLENMSVIIMKNVSNVIIHPEYSPESSITIIPLSKEYMALQMTGNISRLFNNSSNLFLLFGVNQTLSKRIQEVIEESEVFRIPMGPEQKLFDVDSSACAWV